MLIASLELLALILTTRSKKSSKFLLATQYFINATLDQYK